MRRTFRRVLYVDLDVHHGDGVQEAFYASDRVFTFSVHHHAPGFFPACSGSIDEIGAGNGQFYTFNAPMRRGFASRAFAAFVSEALALIVGSFCPDAIFIQAGMDTLIGDPCASFCLTPDALCSIVADTIVCGFNLPTVIVGGGGYHSINVARCWTLLLARLSRADVPDDIPASSRFFPEYAPDFSMRPQQLHAGQKDENLPDWPDTVMARLRKNLSFISCK